MYAHDAGAHYVTVQYVDGVFMIYNAGSQQNEVIPASSFDVWARDNNYVTLSITTLT
jgi:hypothetical protein